MPITDAQRLRASNNRAKAILKLAKGKRHGNVKGALERWRGELPAGADVCSRVTDESTRVAFARVVRFYNPDPGA